MGLIDSYLPDYSFRETHSRDIAADAVTVIEAAAAYRPETDAFFRRMIALRELPMRLGELLRPRSAPRPAPFGLHKFTLLEKQDGHALVYGLIGQFWKPDYGLVTVPDSQAFLDFSAPGTARLAIGFEATPQADGRTQLVTETRVHCPDKTSRIRFAPYWYLIRPVSGLIRGRILSSIKTASEDAEQARMLKEA